MNNTQDTKAILVLGGTGKTGRRGADRLIRRGLPVRVGSRSGEPPFHHDLRCLCSFECGDPPPEFPRVLCVSPLHHAGKTRAQSFQLRGR
jgi:nucleoside-diphosphate-sugar epimerase